MPLLAISSAAKKSGPVKGTLMVIQGPHLVTLGEIVALSGVLAWHQPEGGRAQPVNPSIRSSSADKTALLMD
jgi:hypothetical protein